MNFLTTVRKIYALTLDLAPFLLSIRAPKHGCFGCQDHPRLLVETTFLTFLPLYSKLADLFESMTTVAFEENFKSYSIGVTGEDL